MLPVYLELGVINMRALIKLFSIKEPMISRETYGTIKRRLATSDLFVEVTDSTGKLCLNKTGIEMIGQAEEKPVVKKAKKK